VQPEAYVRIVSKLHHQRSELLIVGESHLLDNFTHETRILNRAFFMTISFSTKVNPETFQCLALPQQLSCQSLHAAHEVFGVPECHSLFRSRDVDVQTGMDY
jgi:hypothetical protein